MSPRQYSASRLGGSVGCLWQGGFLGAPAEGRGLGCGGGRYGFGRAEGRCLLACCAHHVVQAPAAGRWLVRGPALHPCLHRHLMLLSTARVVALTLPRFTRCRLPWDFRRGTGQPVTADSFPAAGPASGAAPAPDLAAEEAAAAAAGPPAPADALTDTETAGGPCLIKGNINRAGAKIFHVPGSPSYDQTQIDESRGERWFCSEEEAVAAGWRAPG